MPDLAPENALGALTERLRAEESVISPHVRDADAVPAFGLVVGADRDLALLAGDYLYARGLERLAALEDLEAVRELSDLISLSAQIHAQGDGDSVADALWLAPL